MSKFNKRILSASKNSRNCLILGSGLGYFNEIVDTFDTVFIVFEKNRNVRKRNIIYRETLDNIDVLSEIDFVFVDAAYFDVFKKLRPLWLKCRPVFLLEGEDLFGLENYKYFRSESYALVEKYKNMQKWIPQ
jgi:hypothetical protein